MTTTDTTERGLEARITAILYCRTARVASQWPTHRTTHLDPGQTQPTTTAANCVDLNQFSAFLTGHPARSGRSAVAGRTTTPTRRQFLARLKREVRSRGIIDVLRTGHQPPPAPR